MNVKQKDKPSSAGNSGPWTPVLCFNSLRLQSRRQFCVSFLTPAFYWHIATSIGIPELNLDGRLSYIRNKKVLYYWTSKSSKFLSLLLIHFSLFDICGYIS